MKYNNIIHKRGIVELLDLRKSVIFFLLVFSLPITNIKSDSISKNNIFTITSESQFHSGEGILKANGNVIIEGENDLTVYADKLIYKKKLSKLHLIGNVILRNYSSNEIFIENASGDELIIFLNKASFQLNKKNGERVKTKFRL